MWDEWIALLLCDIKSHSQNWWAIWAQRRPVHITRIQDEGLWETAFVLSVGGFYVPSFKNPSVLLSRSVQACLTSARLCLVVKAQLFIFVAVSGVWCCCDRWRSVFWQVFKPADSQCKLQEQFNTPFPIPLNKTGKTPLADRYDGGRLNNLSFTFTKCTIVTLVPTILP